MPDTQKIFLIVDEDEGEITVMMRAETESIIGDAVEVVSKDESFLGHPYADLLKLGNGEHVLENRPVQG